jgi:hypothetical protein
MDSLSSDSSHETQLVIISGVVSGFTTLTVIGRLACRIKMKTRIGIDDCLAFIAAVSSYLCSSFNLTELDARLDTL